MIINLFAHRGLVLKDKDNKNMEINKIKLEHINATKRSIFKLHTSDLYM